MLIQLSNHKNHAQQLKSLFPHHKNLQIQRASHSLLTHSLIQKKSSAPIPQPQQNAATVGSTAKPTKQTQKKFLICPLLVIVVVVVVVVVVTGIRLWLGPTSRVNDWLSLAANKER
jgi:hypothetical protein